jgi:hypothetical protein
MLQRVLAAILSLAVVLSANPILFAAGAAGQISGVAMLRMANTSPGLHGCAAWITRATRDDHDDHHRLRRILVRRRERGSYVVELVSNGAVSGTSAPVTLTSKSMTAGNVRIMALAASSAAAAPVPGGSFWTSTLGMITVATIAAGITTAFVVTQDDASASK